MKKLAVSPIFDNILGTILGTNRDNYGITTIYSYYSSALGVALVDLFARPLATEPGTEDDS